MTTTTVPAPGTKVSFYWAPPNGVGQQRTGTVVQTRPNVTMFGPYQPTENVTSVACDDGETVWTSTAHLVALP